MFRYIVPVCKIFTPGDPREKGTIVHVSQFFREQSRG